MEASPLLCIDIMPTKCPSYLPGNCFEYSWETLPVATSIFHTYVLPDTNETKREISDPWGDECKVTILANKTPLHSSLCSISHCSDPKEILRPDSRVGSRVQITSPVRRSNPINRKPASENLNLSDFRIVGSSDSGTVSPPMLA